MMLHPQLAIANKLRRCTDLKKLVGSIDATNTNSSPTWTNKPGALHPALSQQVVTNSATQYINVPDEISLARRTYNPPTSATGETVATSATPVGGRPKYRTIIALYFAIVKGQRK